MRRWQKAGRFMLSIVSLAALLAAGGPFARAGEIRTVTAAGAVWQTVPVPVGEAMTVVSRLAFPGEAEERSVDTFILAGFAVEEGSVPRSLAVRWRRDGWFQIWTLGIDSALGNLPSTLRPASGSGAWAGYRSVTLEGGKFPEAGHVYETTVSYVPETGYLAVAVVDLTAQQTFYRGTFQLEPVDRTLYAGAGVLFRDAAPDTEPEWLPAIVQWLPEPVPAGVRWRLLERSASGEWLPVTHLDRSKELALEVGAGGSLSLPGELRFVLRSPATGEELLLGNLSEAQGTIVIPVDGQRLPAGRLAAAMEYVRDGSVRYAEARTVEAGVIHVTADRLQFDPAGPALHGALVVRTDGPMKDFVLEGRAAARGRLLLSPTERTEAWSLSTAVTPGTEPLRLPFTFAAGKEPAQWTVQVDVDVRAPEGVRVHLEVPSPLTIIAGDAPQVVLNQVKEQYLAEFVLPAGAVILNVPPPREDGSWADIDYRDQSVGGWKAVPHLERVLQMAVAYAAPQSTLRGSERLRGEIVRALEYWVTHKFRNPNWWWNVIWQPQRLGDVLLLMGDALPDGLREAALRIMRAEVLQTAPGAYTGANLVWNEGNRLRIGLITEDLEMVAQAFAAMASELRVVSFGKEGIQADGSFHQHGAMLYSGGYGASFVGDLVRFAEVARGTTLFPPEALAVLVDYILDGQQWMVRGLTFDFSATGRVLSREQASGNAAYLIGLVRKLAALPGVPRRDELEAFLGRLLGAGAPLVGNKYFWTSDFMVHHRPEFYVSVKASSHRTLATEIGNYENLKGHHLGDGMMFMMRTGTEYDEAFPVWNWELLPGTTVRHMEHPLLLDGSWLTVPGAGNPAGGVSDGMYGALAMYLQRDGMAARKAWFFFDREFVALGTDIRVPAGGTVTTSVNQTRLAGDVVVGREGGAEVLAPNSELLLDDVRWVYHGGVTYVLPAGGAVHVANKVQTGRWSDINSVYSNQPLSLPIFSMWFDHSGDGAKDYAYIVAPGVQRSDAAAYAAAHAVAIAANDARAQAVWHGELRQLQAVFWQAGAVTAPEGLAVAADAPALVIVKERDGAFEVTVGPLERKPGTVTVRVERTEGGRRFAAAGQFTFAAGDALGSSVTQTLAAVPGEEA